MSLLDVSLLNSFNQRIAKNTLLLCGITEEVEHLLLEPQGGQVLELTQVLVSQFVCAQTSNHFALQISYVVILECIFDRSALQLCLVPLFELSKDVPHFY
jgi:hypothetical protein